MFEQLTWLKVTAVVIASMFIQDVLLNQVVIFGSHPDLMVALPVTAGIIAGAEVGALMGFFAGFAADLLMSTPFGLSALIFALVGYGAGAFVASPYGHDFYSARILGAVLGCIFATLFYAFVAAFIGQPGILTSHLVVTTVVVGAGSVLLGPVALTFWRWALADMRRSGFGSHMPSGGSALR